MKRLLLEQQIPAQQVPSHWMIGAKTRLVDTWTPGLELLRLPRTRKSTGRVRVYADHGISLSGRRRFWNWPRPIEGWLLDARYDGNANIAHTLQNVAVDAALAEAALKSELPVKLTVIMRQKSRPYCVKALQLLGFEVHCTDQSVEGKFLKVEYDGHGALLRVAQSHLPKRWKEKSPRKEVPRKVYLSRRGVRAVKNDQDVQRFLRKRGYQTLFMEDLPVEQQFNVVTRANQIVGVHGASLAGLSLRDPANGPLELVELFGSYIVSCYRDVASGLSGRWAGVRGVLDARAVAGFQQGVSPRAFQACNFEVDLDALALAIDCVQGGNPEERIEWLQE